MKALIKIDNPDEVELSLTLTMPLGTWKQLKEDLDSKWPSYHLRTIITDMIIKAETHFISEEKIER